MIFVDGQFPDPRRTNMDSPCPQLGWPNFISHAWAADVCMPAHAGPLSLKCAFHGQEVYETDSARFAVEDSSYLILNDGQRYASNIQAETEVESFCVFFRRSFADEVLRSLLLPEDRLLDEPAGSLRQPVMFFDRLYPHDDLVSPLLLRMRAVSRAGRGSEGWLEDQFHDLLERMLRRHRDITGEIERIPARRLATRVELYRRLHHARDYMESSLGLPVSLADMAEVACLSPHHFLRLFKQTFRETPHQYLTRRRIEQAQALLQRTDRPVTSICLEVGFTSLGSFSWLFRRHTGLSPTEYRGQRAGRAQGSKNEEARMALFD